MEEDVIGDRLGRSEDEFLLGPPRREGELVEGGLVGQVPGTHVERRLGRDGAGRGKLHVVTGRDVQAIINVLPIGEGAGSHPAQGQRRHRRH